jgi:VanZ family protein
VTWRLWLPVACYAALIFTLSSIPNLRPPISVNNADKAAHFLEYAVFGLLLYRAARLTWQRPKAIVPIAFTILCGLVVATLDELYQGTVVGRQKSANDALADLIGVTVAALIGQWIAHVWILRRQEAGAEP